MHLQFLVSTETNPYRNVAVENYLVDREEASSMVLYLWKNRRTVVIGQNQNPYAECDVERLLADGGYVMRRTTGGGAVYHDDGNLNFSFVAPYEHYNQERQFEVIRQALREFGLEAEQSGRNDLLCQGRKFSGNAFSKGRRQRLHHGTLLIKGNMDDLARYLRVRPAKLQRHGVQSVRSRVVNLSELNAAITSESMVQPLRRAFEAVYGSAAEELSFGAMRGSTEVEKLYERFASEEWIFGKWRNFTATRSGQFDWGSVDLQLTVDEQKGIITDVRIASDALDMASIDEAQRLLAGASLVKAPISSNFMVRDIIGLAY